MPPCFVSMRRPPFRRWIDSIQCCRFRRAVPSAMDLNTTGTQPCRCMRRWTPRPAAFTERPLDATPAATLSSSSRGPVPAPSADPHHPRQSLGAQDRAGAGVPGAASPRPVPLHTHLLLMAQPGRTLVRENRARGHRPRRLYLRARSGPQAATLHQRLFSQCSAYPLEVLRPLSPHP